jgi:uncharacterized membrane protein YeiH
MRSQHIFGQVAGYGYNRTAPVPNLYIIYLCANALRNVRKAFSLIIIYADAMGLAAFSFSYSAIRRSTIRP